MSNFFSRFAGLTKVLTVFVVLALIAAVLIVFTRDSTKRTLRVDFTSTNSLYEGSDVRILGVPVGTVDKVKAKGDHVEATMTYEGDVRLPTNVKAVIISPAIVGDRFVQLAPAYNGGAVLPDNAKLGVDRTAVPVELDEIYQSLDDLSVALGPEGANKDGSLSSLIEDSATQLDGQGQQLNTTIRNFGKLSQTLSNNKDDLFGSVREVQQFVALLQRNDSSVRAFFNSTARVSTVLEGERHDLAKTLKALSLALIDVRKLVKDNRGELRSNVKNLQHIAEVLGNHPDDIEEILTDGPTALSNVTLTYNGDGGTLDNRADVTELIAGALGGILSGGPTGALAVLCGILPDDDADPTNGCPGLDGLLGILFPGFNLTAKTSTAGLAGALKDATKPDAETPKSPDKALGSLREMLGGGN
jgi:phospholipid/cholesterol/gamma-HCH transport system substrate-binding protein